MIPLITKIAEDEFAGGVAPEFLGKRVEVVGEYLVSSCPELYCGSMLAVESIVALE
ncbi:MAG: hypothetical protein HYV03_03525 [Deltaproteobacteria bacterium]|nr:hypothetical protein [Deltaproteobacteria bacterium]